MARGLSKEELLHVITETATPAAASFGLEIWGIELVGSGRPVARLFVDVPPSGVFRVPASPVSSTFPASPVEASPSTAVLPGDLESNLDQDSPDHGADLLQSMVLPSGVSIDQCTDISRMVGLALDVEEIFPESWVLEVSSPGLERPFFRVDQMLPYIGRELDVVLWDPHPDTPGRRKYRGELVAVAVDDDSFTLRVPQPDDAPLPDLRILWGAVRKARLIHIFPDTSKPGQGKSPSSKKNAASGKGGGKKA